MPVKFGAKVAFGRPPFYIHIDLCEIMSDDKVQKPEIKSKEWSEIIAEQVSAVAWIKGLKIYFSIIGVLGALTYLSSDNFTCGTIGIICFIIAYSLNANKSKEIDVNLDNENTNNDDDDTGDNNTTDLSLIHI